MTAGAILRSNIHGNHCSVAQCEAQTRNESLKMKAVIGIETKKVLSWLLAKLSEAGNIVMKMVSMV